MIKKIFGVLLLFVSSIPVAAFGQGNLPVSRQATFIETYSPTEIALKATGIGPNVDAAEQDAKKAAVYFVLYDMTDPVLQTQREKSSFEEIQQTFFDSKNIEQYITFFGNEVIARVKTKDGVKVDKLVRINKEKLTQDLASQGIIASRERLSASIGNPFIMVLPEAPKGTSPIDLLQKDPNVKKGAEVIESFLTARKYDVQVPEQMQNISELSSAQAGLKGVEDDIAYQLALSIGADVYITYNVQVEQGTYGKKGVVGCRAYETTTARLLGTETGYSPERPNVSDAAVIEEAMNDAVDKVLSRISAYWKDDIARGQQYKLIFKITGKFEDPYVISDAVDEVLKGLTNQRKQIAVTEKTVDYIVWQKNVENTSRFFRELSKAFDSNKDLKDAGAKLKRINLNRKLMLMSIENSGE
ncbi:MAG: DUF6175 family protein [Bacteroidetes bacterium]|nr:DUF6175 family protein [Bacteroidota bacterium]